MKKTARHFRWPCANFAVTGVFKIRITILKSMQYVPFLWNFSQITSNHQQILTIIFRNMILFKYQIYQEKIKKILYISSSMKFHGIPWNFKTVLWNSMKFHGIFSGKIKSSMEFHGTREYGNSSMEFHGTLDLDKIPWNSMWNLRFCRLSSMEFHGTTDVVQMFFKKFHGTLDEVPWIVFFYQN